MENVLSLLRDVEVVTLSRMQRYDVMIFKTNLLTSTDVENLTSVLAKDNRIYRWNVDLEDIDHVLRIEAFDVTVNEIIKYLKETGYNCEELND